MSERMRNYVDLEPFQVPEPARQVAEALALEMFSSDGKGACHACGCLREDAHGKSHYAVAWGPFIPRSRDDIEQARCDRCELRCWPAEAEAEGDVAGMEER